MKLYINKLIVLQWKVQINILVYGKMKKGKMNKDFIVLKYFRNGEQIDCYWNDGDPNFQLFRTWWMLLHLCYSVHRKLSVGRVT